MVQEKYKIWKSWENIQIVVNIYHAFQMSIPINFMNKTPSGT